ncbi:hypothetical protein [Microscilla marina]|uniref:Uncharacterized protein n=1 Tax=Microscilla marina ATCC 23134 TaxID=313606 RepID=A1ZIV4_MICM2|nr:hypothetical protein [Microscilla marina]EAY29490.1 hypothetical protein M23134_00374 [Microscilla marina ATCC 23134]
MTTETIEALIKEISKRRLDKIYTLRLTRYLQLVSESNHVAIGEKLFQLIRFITHIHPVFELDLKEEDYEQLQLYELLKYLPELSQWSRYDKRLFEVLSQPAIIECTLQAYGEVLAKEIRYNPSDNVFRRLNKALDKHHAAYEILQITVRHLARAMQTKKGHLTSVGKYILKQDFTNTYQVFKQYKKSDLYIKLLVTNRVKL